MYHAFTTFGSCRLVPLPQCPCTYHCPLVGADPERGSERLEQAPPDVRKTVMQRDPGTLRVKSVSSSRMHGEDQECVCPILAMGLAAPPAIKLVYPTRCRRHQPDVILVYPTGSKATWSTSQLRMQSSRHKQTGGHMSASLPRHHRKTHFYASRPRGMPSSIFNGLCRDPPDEPRRTMSYRYPRLRSRPSRLRLRLHR